MLAHNPAALEWMVGIGRWIRYSCGALDPRRRELAIPQVGCLMPSEYEFTHHVCKSGSTSVSRGGPWMRWPRRLRGSALTCQNVISWCCQRRASSRPGTTLADELWETLAYELVSSETLDLVFVVAPYVQVVRVLGTLRIDVEPEYEQYLSLLHGRARSDEQRV